MCMMQGASSSHTLRVYGSLQKNWIKFHVLHYTRGQTSVLISQNIYLFKTMVPDNAKQVKLVGKFPCLS